MEAFIEHVDTLTETTLGDSIDFKCIFSSLAVSLEDVTPMLCFQMCS